jgi:peptidoglycan/LPS O-acetylase OafA/YrhL
MSFLTSEVGSEDHQGDLEIAPESAAQLNSNAVDALLVLRAIACLMVVSIHVAPPRNVIYIGQMDFSWLLFSHGMAAVWIFFCLSGYLMGKAFYSGRYALTRSGVINFLRNRILRIAPLYYFSAFILAVLVYPKILMPENWSYIFHILTFTYQAYLTPNAPTFNTSIWSLSVEMQFYCLVPFVYVLVRKYCVNLRTTIAALVTVIFIGFLIKASVYLSFKEDIHKSMYFLFKYWYSPLINNLDIFLIGFLINPLMLFLQKKQHPELVVQDAMMEPEWSETPPPKKRRPLIGSSGFKILACILFVIFYLATAQHFYAQELWGLPAREARGMRTTTTLFVWQPVTAIVTAIFILAFDAKRQTQSKLTPRAILHNPWRVLEIFGILSYGVYLWHGPLIPKLAEVVTSTSPVEFYFMRLSWVLGLSCIFSAITYYLVERPAARYKLFKNQ